MPGDPDSSELWRRVISDDDDEVMPPPGSNKTLTDVREGAAAAMDRARCRVPEALGVRADPAASRAADRRRGAPHRRVSRERLAAGRTDASAPGRPRDADSSRGAGTDRLAADRSGSRPYLADEAPDAYERMVDRYLASPRYGEEMARHWLDVARYADTHGLHLDNERQMWAYRDWVVKAFNDNLPFDQFTVWQVAGDLLPNPTTEQLVASGFNRCNVTTSEGGAIDAEFTYRYAVERTTTVAQAWLGLTAGCAVCHDHKYDPLTMKEFYSLYAFFNNAADPAMDGNINTTTPFLKLPTPDPADQAEAAAAVERDALPVVCSRWPPWPAIRIQPTRPRQRPPSPSSKCCSTTPFPQAPRHAARRETRSPGSSTRRGAASGRRVIRQAHATDCNDTIEFKLRPLVVPQDGRLEFKVRVERRDVPQSISLTALGASGAVDASRRRPGPRRADGVGDRAGTVDAVDGLPRPTSVCSPEIASTA